MAVETGGQLARGGRERASRDRHPHVRPHPTNRPLSERAVHGDPPNRPVANRPTRRSLSPSTGPAPLRTDAPRTGPAAVIETLLPRLLLSTLGAPELPARSWRTRPQDGSPPIQGQCALAASSRKRRAAPLSHLRDATSRTDLDGSVRMPGSDALRHDGMTHDGRPDSHFNPKVLGSRPKRPTSSIARPPEILGARHHRCLAPKWAPVVSHRRTSGACLGTRHPRRGGRRTDRLRAVNSVSGAPEMRVSRQWSLSVARDSGRPDGYAYLVRRRRRRIERMQSVPPRVGHPRRRHDEAL